MPDFGVQSREVLNACSEEIKQIFCEVIKEYDCKGLEGHRSMETQKEYFRTGRTKTLGSKHLSLPSDAIDISPYPIPNKWGEDDFKEKAKFYHFAGYVKGIAKSMGYTIRWGGDWDNDKDFNDQTFDDLVHFEIVR